MTIRKMTSTITKRFTGSGSVRPEWGLMMSMIPGPDRQIFAAKSRHLLCRRGGRRVIGAVLRHDGRRALIYHLAVREDHQNRGIGNFSTKLSGRRDEGILKVALVVLSNNEKGNAFWEKMVADRKDLVYRNRQIGEFNGFHT